MRFVVRDLIHLRPAMVLLAAWAVFTFGVRFLQPTLDSVLIFGVPLGLCLAVQGSLIAFVVMAVWFARLRAA